jgi:hypothetical protein
MLNDKGRQLAELMALVDALETQFAASRITASKMFDRLSIHERGQSK